VTEEQKCANNPDANCVRGKAAVHLGKETTHIAIRSKIQKYCQEVNERPTRIEIPKEGENRLYFKNYHKQMKAPFVIYADLEAGIKNFKGCEKEKEPEASNTEKTSWQETCGCTYTVVRSDRKTWGPMHYRGINAEEMLILQLLKYEEKTREALA